jgi:hypothetical protein
LLGKGGKKRKEERRERQGGSKLFCFFPFKCQIGALLWALFFNRNILIQQGAYMKKELGTEE